MAHSPGDLAIAAVLFFAAIVVIKYLFLPDQ
jgi:hypothetical protein